MPETVKRGAVPFSAKAYYAIFVMSFAIGCSSLARNHLFKLYPDDELGGCLAGDLIDAGGLTTSQFAWTQVPVLAR